MHRHYIKHTVIGYYRKLEKHCKKITGKFDPDSIHEFRVEHKKLRAFLKMLSQEHAKSNKLKISKKLKNTYHVLGSIRDLQQQRQRILEASKYEPQKPRAYRIILQKEIFCYKRKVAEIDLEDVLTESKTKISRSLPHQLRARTFKDFVENKWAAVYAIILSGNFSDDNIHAIRKQLKDLFYSWKEYKEKENGKLSKYVLKGKDEEYFEQLLEELGSYHDKCTAINLLRSDWSDVLANETLLRIKDIWIREKLGMKNLLVNKLTSDIVT